MPFLMVSVTIHNLTSRIFTDFLISHQFGRLISDHACGFGEYCWLHSVANFQGHKMSFLLREGHCQYINWQVIFPAWIAVSVSILPIQGKIRNFIKVSWKFGQVGIGHRGLKWFGLGIFCVLVFLLVSLQWLFSVRNNYISWG